MTRLTMHTYFYGFTVPTIWVFYARTDLAKIPTKGDKQGKTYGLSKNLKRISHSFGDISEPKQKNLGV